MSPRVLRWRLSAAEVTLAIVGPIDTDLRRHLRHRRPVERTERAGREPLAEQRLLPTFEQQERLEAAAPHLVDRPIEPRRVEAVPYERHPAGIEAHAAAL